MGAPARPLGPAPGPATPPPQPAPTPPPRGFSGLVGEPPPGTLPPQAGPTSGLNPIRERMNQIDPELQRTIDALRGRATRTPEQQAIWEQIQRQMRGLE